MWIIYVIIMIINMIYIVFLEIKIIKLENKLHQANIDAIKEINKIRKEDK